MYKCNVQHRLDPAILNALRIKIFVFHIRDQLRFRRACTFDTKTSGLVSIKTVWHLNVVLLKGCFKPHSHCDDVATVHPDAGQPVYRDAPGHIS